MDGTMSNFGPMAAAIAERATSWPASDPKEGVLQVSTGAVLDLSREYGAGVLPENVIRAVEISLDQGETHYTTRPGLPALAKAVARKLADEQGLTVDPATEVVISCGGREGMFVALQVLIQPGEKVLVPALRSPFIDEVLRLAQGTPVPVPLLAQDGFEMRASQIEKCLTDTACIYNCSNSLFYPRNIWLNRDI